MTRDAYLGAQDRLGSMAKKETSENQPEKKGRVEIERNGPYVVSGNLPLSKEIICPDEDGEPLKWAAGEKYPPQEEYRLCRCGQSKNKPYCDKTHVKIDFDGTETASLKKYGEQADWVDGPDLILYDVQKLCAAARFCHREGGTWELTEKSGDKRCRETAIQQAGMCPSGRLTACDKKTKKALEPVFEQEITLVEDPEENVSGPIWVKGGVPIKASDGSEYEVRNRVTLCRCGESRNKPFCDGSHIPFEFNDGDKSLRRNKR
ncbi:Iron-binding zinc finger CDGSH type [uncultured archaeon]|nr:Iron-binding zinc finger CDGSH type [uncultured archaeon]